MWKGSILGQIFKRPDDASENIWLTKAFKWAFSRGTSQPFGDKFFYSLIRKMFKPSAVLIISKESLI